VSSTGKRIARYVPRVIGAWLAGLYDNDKLVLKAAQESVVRGFPTEKKRQNIWRVYRSAILEFVEDAVLQQTPLTLSDERTVRPDDAQAKHARVVATATQVFNQLLS
jgi:[phosphatase 2A protein]-leucine-carboxy methyltransferase